MFEAHFKTVRSLTATLAANSLAAAVAEARGVAQERSSADELYHLTAVVDRATGQVVPLPAGDPLPPPGEVDVLWTVRLRADSGEQAASAARLMQFDPSSLASVFRTCDSRGHCQVIDLQDSATSPH